MNITKLVLLLVQFSTMICCVRLRSRADTSDESKTENRFLVVFLTHGDTRRLERSLRAFLSSKHREKFPAFVSLDSPEALEEVQTLVRSVERELGLAPKTAVSEIVVKTDTKRETSEQQKIDDHVFFALRQALKKNSKFIVFVEDDLVVSPDFLQLMVSGSEFMDKDISQSVFCVSAWNNHATPEERGDPRRLIRSSVFPGLGWMMTSEVVRELVNKWPGRYHASWDGWTSRPDTTRGRECIAPELPRTHHIGANGVHVKDNAVYDANPRAEIPADENTFDFRQVELDNYEREIRTLIDAARTVNVDELASVMETKNGVYLIPMMNLDIANIAKYFHSFCAWCMAHKGVIVRRKPENNNIFIFVHKTRGAQWLSKDHTENTPMVFAGDMWEEY